MNWHNQRYTVLPRHPYQSGFLSCCGVIAFTLVWGVIVAMCLIYENVSQALARRRARG